MQHSRFPACAATALLRFAQSWAAATEETCLLQTHAQPHAQVHALVSEPAELAVGMEQLPANASLADGSYDVYFLHISKCAGSSATLDLHDHVNGKVVSSETCWYDIRAQQGRVVTFLRQPRSHVISQYFHCDTCAHEEDRYFVPQNWPDLRGWLQHWASFMETPHMMPVADEATFHCYLPIDLQTRQMSCKAAYSFCPGQDNVALSDPEMFGGNLSVALSNLHELAYIGITELYQESMCVIHAQEFGELPPYCECDNTTAWNRFQQHTDDHGVAAHLEWTDLPHSAIELIDSLTREDWELYTQGITRFKSDLQEVEQMFGKRILCDYTRLDELISKGG